MPDLEQWIRLINPDPVAIDQTACLRARHRRSPCRRCSAVCPVDAISFDGRLQVDPEGCTRCGLCAGACPTGALQVDGLTEEHLLSAAPGETVRLRCARGPAGGRTMPCLGWLTADHLVDLGLRAAGVELAPGDCAGCTLRQGGEQARSAAAAAGALLDALGRSALLRWVAAPAAAARGLPAAGPADQLTRRQLFALWRGQGARAVHAVLPERDVSPLRLPARVPARRVRWLRRAVSPPSDVAVPAGAGAPWVARTVAEACTGCGICAAFCPTGALAAVEEDGAWTLRHQAAACVGCGTCHAVCPSKAVGAADTVSVAELVEGGGRQLVRRTRAVCTECRRPFLAAPGQPRCQACRSEGRMLGLGGSAPGAGVSPTSRP